MFYFTMNENAAEAAAKSLKSWTEAMRSWNAAYARTALAGPQTAGALAASATQPTNAFDVVDPKWAMETAGLYVRAWSDTVRATSESWEAMASVSNMSTRLEPNPFGLTGFFTSTLPSGIATPDTAPRVKPVASAPASAPRAAEPAPEKGASSTFLKEPIGEPDDLTQIKGVGPKLRDALNDLGVFHFWQIASLSEKDTDWVSDQLGFKGRVEREEWVEQARGLIEHVG
ncbi:MAG: hypothetical protein MI723_06565 [Caulobacterales bacterium]|nr:hypothetical protein [Caulobacterales bacterium]